MTILFKIQCTKIGCKWANIIVAIKLNQIIFIKAKPGRVNCEIISKSLNSIRSIYRIEFHVPISLNFLTFCLMSFNKIDFFKHNTNKGGTHHKKGGHNMTKADIKEFKTSNKNLLVRISKKENGTLLFGRGIDAETRRPIPKCTAKLRLPPPLNTKQIPDFERMLVRKIETKYEKASLAKTEKPISAEKGIFSLAYAAIEDKSIFHRRSWNDDTFKTSLTYFENHVLPLLDELGTDIGSDDILKFQDKLIQTAFESKRSNSSRNDATATVNGKMFRMNYIYQVLRGNSPSFNLPDIDLTMNNRHKKVQAEQPKALPDSMRIMLARLLFRLVATPLGGLALATAMMLFTGLRTAESAAVFFGKIINEGTYAKYFVEHQEKDRFCML